jgi:hypothetical protein
MRAAALTVNGGMACRQLPVGIGIILGLGMLWSVLVSWGNELSTNAGGYTIQNWQMEQGLPQISITSIAQTPDGG